MQNDWLLSVLAADMIFFACAQYKLCKDHATRMDEDVLYPLTIMWQVVRDMIHVFKALDATKKLKTDLLYL